VAFSVKVKGADTVLFATPETGVEFTVSEGFQGLAALPIAVRAMKKGERVMLDVKPECERWA
jgi:hypothetical protein